MVVSVVEQIFAVTNSIGVMVLKIHHHTGGTTFRMFYIFRLVLKG